MAKDLTLKDLKMDTEGPDAMHIDTLLHPANPDSSRLLVSSPTEHYSAGLMARAVEDCDAHLVNLDVTPLGDGANTVVYLRVNRRDPSTVVRSLERFGFTVLDARGDGRAVAADEDRARERAAELIRLLEV